MSTFTSTSPAFRENPRAWMTRMIDRMMTAGVPLTERDRKVLVAKRAYYAKHTDRIPGPHLYEQLCRIARACGVLAMRPHGRAADPSAPAVQAPPAPIPARFALGARIPSPPPLRRPVALAEPPETWDPAGMPGL